MDRTGYALGNLSPIYYFQHGVSGHVILAAYDKGKPEQSRRVFEERFKPQGYLWCETRNLSEVDSLQKKLIDQELAEAGRRDEQDDRIRAAVRRETGSRLRQQMQSAACNDYEREFIRIYLESRESRRNLYQQRWSEAQHYLWIREFDSTSKVEDRMKGQNSL